MTTQASSPAATQDHPRTNGAEGLYPIDSGRQRQSDPPVVEDSGLPANAFSMVATCTNEGPCLWLGKRPNGC